MMKKGYLVVIGLFLIALTSIAHADNLALSGIATQSSDLSPGVGIASKAIDGITDGNFSNGSVTHTNLDNPSWWMVDLQATYPINEIVIWNRTDAAPERLSNFNVSVLSSSGQVVWNDNYFTNGGYPNPSLDILLLPNITGEFVKVTLNLFTGDNYLSLAEVQVYGNPVPIPPSVWLFGSGLVGLVGWRRFRKS